jgi:hypothetical protein
MTSKINYKKYITIFFATPICIVWDLLFFSVKHLYLGMEKLDKAGGDYLDKFINSNS